MNEGDRVQVERGEQSFEGVLLPSSTEEHLVLKLESGYNVGVDRESAQVDVLESNVYDVESAQDGTGESAIEFDDTSRRLHSSQLVAQSPQLSITVPVR